MPNHLINIKDIHIGKLIKTKWKEKEILLTRTCSFFNCSETEIRNMFASKSIDSDMLLRWSKHLEYDFFRLYSHHLILYAPVATLSHTSNTQNKNSALPVFRKNLYTQEIIDFILEMINSGEMTRQQVIDEYRIPKTTLYKWISKYRNS